MLMIQILSHMPSFDPDRWPRFYWSKGNCYRAPQATRELEREENTEARIVNSRLNLIQTSFMYSSTVLGNCCFGSRASIHSFARMMNEKRTLTNRFSIKLSLSYWDFGAMLIWLSRCLRSPAEISGLRPWWPGGWPPCWGHLAWSARCRRARPPTWSPSWTAFQGRGLTWPGHFPCRCKAGAA